MTNPVWPVTRIPASCEWRLHKSGTSFRSPFTGEVQTIDFMGEYWEVVIGIPGEGRLKRHTAELEAMVMWLAGGGNQVDIYNWVRPVPRGTLRGSPTLATVTVRGDDHLHLAVAAGSTLEAGDFIGCGDQVFMVKSRCVEQFGAMQVPVVNRVRGVIAEDSPITWDRPLVAMVMLEQTAGIVHQPGIALPTQLTLVEP